MISSSHHTEDDQIPVGLNISFFPQDVLELIFSYLPVTGEMACKLSPVSKQFCAIANGDEYWKNIWCKAYTNSENIIKNNYRRAYIKMAMFRAENPKFMKKNKKQNNTLTEAVKISVIGGHTHGESLLILRFVYNSFMKEYEPTDS
jgi:hypothetical protein